ncbi:MAG: DNA primase [bacterium]|nr:DNA primase [bacterium]
MNNAAMDEIRARLNIEDLAAEYLELRRAGRNFKALSPWTNERTPSFVVSPEKQIWHDFSSGKGGDIFGFVMEFEGMNFREALEFLARKTGVELPSYDAQKAKLLAEKKQRLYEILNIAANFYQHFLARTPEAMKYVFEKRKMSREIVRGFKIGYAPENGRVLTDFLLKKGFSKKEIDEAGLLNRFGGDIFRGRMVISLQDLSGAPVGFTGRILKDEPNSPKYLNTPQTLLYDKSSNVFAISHAKNAIRKAGFAVVVEGNMDAIASHQAGVENVVATAGTAMTVRHLKTIARFSSDIRLCFDADDAGIKATERAITLAQEAGVELSIITLADAGTDAKDPDELIQRDAEKWKNLLSKSKPAVDWVFDQYEKRLDISTASGKRQFSTIALKLVENLGDPVEKEHYLNEISRRSGISREALLAKNDVSKPKPEPKKRPVKISKIENPIKDEFLYEDDLLALAISLPELRPKLAEIPDESLHSEEKNQILQILKQNSQDDLKNFDNYVKILLLKADERLGGIKESAASEMERLVDKVKTQNLQKRKESLDAQLEEAEIQGDDAAKMAILAEIIKLNKELKSGKK